MVQIGHGQTIWNGPTTNFAPTAVYSASNPATYDLLTPGVALARNRDFPLFNAKKESSYSNAAGSPQDTLWAEGTLSELDSLIASNSFKKWGSVIGGGGTGAQLYRSLPGKTFVVHLFSENIYLSLTFITWNSANNTGSSLYSYSRTTPSAAAPAPTVSITNPANNSVSAAPANVQIAASASVASGAVTNVTFFSGTTSLGSVTTSPFSFTASNLPANNYSFRAVATAAGISATSTPVSISVVTPMAISNSTPSLSNGVFSFSYSANIGLAYVVQNSADLVNWSPLFTNTASTVSMQATDTFLSTGPHFYRVMLQPNP